jgi:hypothetical protein
MGVGVYLTGTYASDEVGQSPEDWLEQVASWLEGHEVEPLMLCESGVNSDEQPCLSVQIHPCAEDVEISVPQAGICAVSARTSSAGPGYHIFVCDLLHALGSQFRIEWDGPDDDAEDLGDETGYFFNGENEGVRQGMLHWLSALARVVVENSQDDDVGIRMVSMPMDYSYPDRPGILTPIGPREPAWFAQLVEAPERGVGFFPWWTEGVGAGFFHGRALCRLWQDVRWRAPISEDEGEMLMDVHLDLERAYHLDPTCEVPWREWREVIGYLNDYFGYAEFQHEDSLEQEIERRAGQIDPASALIGYRRGPVHVTLTGGWSLTIPGEMAEEWEDSGETWSAWHGGRTVWFTSWSVCGENDEAMSAEEILESRPWPEEGKIIEHQDGPLVGRAVFMPYEEDGQTLWNLKGYSAVEGGFALCSVYLQDENDLEWALGVWKSMRA